MVAQHTTTPLVNFGLPHDAHTCPLKTEVKSSDPAKG
jgi:hypothetical protein